jgi:hypothetical protein
MVLTCVNRLTRRYAEARDPPLIIDRFTCQDSGHRGAVTVRYASRCGKVPAENVSGGGPYGLIVPDGCADGLFAGETTMPFVSHLNHVFSHGGFPGQTFLGNHWQRKQALARDLLPL